MYRELTDEQAHDIVFAIIRQAAKDLVDANNKIKDYNRGRLSLTGPQLEKEKELKADALKFFNSRWYYVMVNIDKDKMIERLLYSDVRLRDNW